MVTIFIVNAFLYLIVLLLSLIVIYLSKKGYFNVKLKKYCETNTITEIFVLLFIIGGLIMVIIQILLIGINYILIDFRFEYLNVTDQSISNTNTQDPVR